MMKRTILFLLLTFLSYNIYARDVSPVGLWISYHPNFKNPVGIVKIVKYKDELLGEIIRVTPTNKSLLKSCPSCTDYIKQRPLTGPVMMCNYKKSGKRKWKGGEILDSSTAKLYPSSLQLNYDGDVLYVRAHIGLAFSTTKWKRITREEINKYMLGPDKKA